jgi:hypothetical protein
MFKQYKSRKSDEYYTPKHVWEKISPLLNKEKVIWEAFHRESDTHVRSSEYLREIGFNVVQTKKDFFEENHGDVIVSNPPYSKNKKILLRLAELNKPFCLLLNECCLHSNYFKKTFQDTLDEIQLIIPKKINYLIKSEEEENELLIGKGCPFYSIFICWKMNLEKDINFI